MIEFQFDAVVGPTHHYGGLGVGNLASQEHRGETARPRDAALQGLQKMAMVASLGVRQAVLPPPVRPAMSFFRELGFAGSKDDVIRQVAKDRPDLLSVGYSASSMWTANAATVTCRRKTSGLQTDLTIANLASSLHRSLEPPQTEALFREVFAGPSFFVHRSLSPSLMMRDEGAANHMTLWTDDRCRGIEVYVYGAENDSSSTAAMARYPARQTRLASEAIARRHAGSAGNNVLIQQHPAAIDAGAFHNDVVAASFGSCLLHHELAFAPNAGRDGKLRPAAFAIEDAFESATGKKLIRLEVSNQDLTLQESIACYLFNSQVLPINEAATEGRRSDHCESLRLLCPIQVQRMDRARRIVESWVNGNTPIDDVRYVDLGQSMQNGGGPACLRLRVPMVEQQSNALPEGILWSDSLHERLRTAIESHYPITLALSDLADPMFVEQSEKAVAAIRKTLGLGLAW